MRSNAISGSVYLKKGARGASWYYRARLPREVRKRLGPAWTEKGRPPTGYFTKKMAQEALAAILTDARRGTVQGAVKTGATFADASAEWLRYVEHDRKRRPSTIQDYRGIVGHALDPEFGTLPLEGVTMERIDRYRARLLEEGVLSARTINKEARRPPRHPAPGDAGVRADLESGCARRSPAAPTLGRVQRALTR